MNKRLSQAMSYNGDNDDGDKHFFSHEHDSYSLPKVNTSFTLQLKILDFSCEINTLIYMYVYTAKFSILAQCACVLNLVSF